MIVLILILLLIAAIVIRTLLFTPKKTTVTEAEEVSFDREENIRALSELVKCKTVSYTDPDFDVPMKMARLPMCVHQSYYVQDNKYYDQFRIVY